jgi:hypothetical protein
MAKPTSTSTTTRPVRRNPAPGRRPAAAPASKVRWDIPLTSTNLIILAAGIAVIIIGYLLMSSGIADDPLHNDGVWNNASAVTIAPILLGLGYCVIIPFALLYRRKGETVEQVVNED